MTVETEVQAADSAAGNDEFENAFAEYAKAREPDDVQAAEEPPAAAEESQTEEASANAVQPQTAEDEVSRKLDEAQKRAQELEHRLKSDAGRQAALQRKVQELQAQLEAGPRTKESERKYSAKMTQLMADFPEIAEAVQEEIDSRIKQVQSEVSTAVTPLRVNEAKKELAEAETRVREVFPDFDKTVNTPEFIDWFKRQPSPVQALAGSREPSDAIAMLNYYGATSGKPTLQPNPEVQEIKAKRDAALQRNATVRNTSATPIADAPDDFESSFAFFAKKREKQRERTY